MIEILSQLGISVFSIFVVVIIVTLIRELWGLFKTQRMDIAQKVISKKLDLIDSQLSDFYLPLSQRLKLSKYIFNLTRNWMDKSKTRFDNRSVGIISTDERGLSKLIILRLFLPLNKELECIILNNIHLKHPNDMTDYHVLLSHLILWRTFEEAVLEEDINSYEGGEFLTFPVEEVENIHKNTQKLQEERDILYTSIIGFQIPIMKLKI